MSKNQNKQKKSSTQTQQNNNKAKKKFELQEGETIDQCLERIKTEGYMPTKRMEKPIFKEIETEEGISYQPAGRKVIFEATFNKRRTL